MQKSTAIKVFNEKYLELKEGEKHSFSRIVNKLLQVNFLTRKKPGTATDFSFILAYKEAFEAFLALIDFELNIKRSDEVIYIRNTETFNHLNLRKDESLLILVIRVLYQRKFAAVTLDENVEVFLSDIHDELTRIGYLDNKRITKERLRPALRMLKNYNIIDYINPANANLNDDDRIKIYPSILYVTNLESIEAVLKLMDQYVKGDEANEEADEDQIS